MFSFHYKLCLQLLHKHNCFKLICKINTYFFDSSSDCSSDLEDLFEFCSEELSSSSSWVYSGSIYNFPLMPQPESSHKAIKTANAEISFFNFLSYKNI